MSELTGNWQVANFNFMSSSSKCAVSAYLTLGYVSHRYATLVGDRVLCYSPALSSTIRERNFGYQQTPASPDPAFEIRLFDILRFNIFRGFFLLSQEESPNVKPLNIEQIERQSSFL